MEKYYFHFGFSVIFYQCVEIECRKYFGVFWAVSEKRSLLPYRCRALPIGYSQELNKQPSHHLDCNYTQATPAKITEKQNVVTYSLDKLMGTIYLSTKISKDNIRVVFWAITLRQWVSCQILCLAVNFLNLNLNYKKSRNFALVIICSIVCVWIYMSFQSRR